MQSLDDDEKQRFIEVGSHTGSDQAMIRASAWLSECLLKHKLCKLKNEEESWWPSRVLDLNGGTSNNPALLLREELPAHGRYLTLSHSWGNEIVFRLLSSNIDSLRKMIPLHELSLTFQQTIEVCKSLGERYLWIDSLCIIQDSKADWLQESAEMGKVYLHAYCNISATAAKDGSEGCFFPRTRQSIGPAVCNCHWRSANPGKPVLCRVFFEDLWYRDVLEARLGMRGWVVQERILSPRKLLYASSQLFWQCREVTACEAFPAGLHPVDPDYYDSGRQGLVVLLNELETGQRWDKGSDGESNSDISALAISLPPDNSPLSSQITPMKDHNDFRTLSDTPIDEETGRFNWNASDSESANSIIDSETIRVTDPTGSEETQSETRTEDMSPISIESDLDVFDRVSPTWDAVLAAYTKAALTFTTDRLIAIEGLAALIQDVYDNVYVAGLWRRQFLEQLFWKIVDGKQGNGAPSFRPVPGCGPTWSWVSVEGVQAGSSASGIAKTGHIRLVKEPDLEEGSTPGIGRLLSNAIIIEAGSCRALVLKQSRHLQESFHFDMLLMEDNFDTLVLPENLTAMEFEPSTYTCFVDSINNRAFATTFTFSPDEGLAQHEMREYLCLVGAAEAIDAKRINPWWKGENVRHEVTEALILAPAKKSGTHVSSDTQYVRVGHYSKQIHVRHGDEGYLYLKKRTVTII